MRQITKELNWPSVRKKNVFKRTISYSLGLRKIFKPFRKKEKIPVNYNMYHFSKKKIA